MENLKNIIKRSYDNKVVRDYFSFEFGKYHINFNNDTGKWYFRVWKDTECVYESDMLTSGLKLTDAAINKAVKLIEQIA